MNTILVKLLSVKVRLHKFQQTNNAQDSKFSSVRNMLGPFS